jgi:outer membrane lipoprotein
MRHLARTLLPLCTLAVTLALDACAPAPIYKNTPDAVAAVPAQVAQSPGRYAGNPVIWGGRIVQVSNLADHSDIELLAYPLDGSQRPKANDAGNGRFIAVLPGFAEPLNYPPGALMTVSGKLVGSHAGKVGDADYVFPLVSATQSHVWTPDELRRGHSNIQFGLGVGVGIH